MNDSLANLPCPGHHATTAPIWVSAGSRLACLAAVGALSLTVALCLAVTPLHAAPPASTGSPVITGAANPSADQSADKVDGKRDQAPPDQPVAAQQIAFEADQIDYDYKNDIVTASGHVVVRREDNTLWADTVVWNRKTGKVTAKGSVAIENPTGDTAYADSVEVTQSLRDGVVDNLLLVLKSGGRLAAEHGERRGPIYVLHHAVYSPCRIEDDKGCPKKPTWQIEASKVVYDSTAQRVRYTGARIELFGLPLIPLPGLRHDVGDQGGSGLLVPDVGYDRRNGLEFAEPYYFRIASNRSLTITPHIYSAVLPMIEGDYKALLSRGAYEIKGYATVSGITSPTDPDGPISEDRLRGYIAASGKFQFDSNWSLEGSIRYVSDRTFLNRYDISREDRLRSTINLQRIGTNSYFSIAGWAFETLRAGDPTGQVPIALPAIDYRLRLPDPLLGGTLQFQANSLAITRTLGEDDQRAFASATWTHSRLTPLGQELTLTGLLRGDVYHSSDNDLTSTLIYQGNPGWQARALAAFAVDVRWPFIGPAFGGSQQLTPRIQVVLAPELDNLSVPNEDSRSIDLEDSNLFAINRFPGYDRFEDSSRITYGFDYRLDRPYFSLDATIGQSYRLNDRPTILPPGTGLSDRLSDIVGRVQLRYRDFISLTHSWRLDKDNLAVRRNEIDATVGSKKTYAQVGYLQLNRNVSTAVEDLQDIQEVRLAGRVAFARHWSIFGSTNIDLTGQTSNLSDPNTDPTGTLSGFEPVRHRIGIAYEDDCLVMGLTWRRDYQTVGDARRGNSFQLRLVFKNLGM